MKTILALSLMLISLTSFAGTKCYNTAFNAAANQAVIDGYIENVSEFVSAFGNEFDDYEHNGSWQREFFNFGNGSSFYIVEVHSVGTKCFVKKVEFAQDDQDWD
jgi:hypothetical protein